MLYIKRKKRGKGIVILNEVGDKMEINIASLTKKHVTIYFKNHPSFKIYREELWEKMEREKAINNLRKEIVDNLPESK